VRVENAEDGVYLTLDAETDADPAETRTLRPCEARALATALRHYAAEYER